MARTVTHHQIYKPMRGGGTRNTTLCGRVSNASDDLNVGEDVTCMLCKAIEANTNHYNFKWIGWEPPS